MDGPPFRCEGEHAADRQRFLSSTQPGAKGETGDSAGRDVMGHVVRAGAGSVLNKIRGGAELRDARVSWLFEGVLDGRLVASDIA